ncbi:hypothetical protein K402DRAFT_218425 [Aulographum hederae CBS 113979]|uniref:Uncharacterized protein n=1 Tax=Aulographum hederae CBS 113979 TaxID=1176131 RepID=A0A6G1GLK7_9PEZI|nr:hypothetical protein K402DRAFT_218425 [Aulographum hederae CBS 113979]
MPAGSLTAVLFLRRKKCTALARLGNLPCCFGSVMHRSISRDLLLSNHGIGSHCSWPDRQLPRKAERECVYCDHPRLYQTFRSTKQGMRPRRVNLELEAQMHRTCSCQNTRPHPNLHKDTKLRGLAYLDTFRKRNRYVPNSSRNLEC